MSNNPIRHTITSRLPRAAAQISQGSIRYPPASLPDYRIPHFPNSQPKIPDLYEKPGI